MLLPQSVTLLLARAEADTDVTGLADAVIKIPSEGRTIEGGFGFFENVETGDWLTIDLKDDDDIYGFGAGATIGTFDDQLVPLANQGFYFMNSQPLELSPIVSDDPRELPGGLYLHICGHKKNIATVDTLYVNLRWGKRKR
jgi:hypothetical protein